MATRAGLDRETVVQTAAALADEEGLERLTLAALAERLGVRTPTLYHYVAGLAGLRRELALAGLYEQTALLGRVVMGKAGDDAVIALAQTLRAFIKEHPGLYAATVPASPPGDSEWMAAAREVVQIALRALAAYHLSDDDAIHTVRILRSVVHGFATLEAGAGFGLPLEVDETFHRLLAMVLQSLAH